MQNDFISGSLPVTGAEDIIDMVEDLTKLDIWYQVRPKGLIILSNVLVSVGMENRCF